MNTRVLQAQALAFARQEMQSRIPDWSLLGRTEQQAPPGEWHTWLYMAGRGSGKTRAGSEWVHQQVQNGAKRIALVAPTAADCRDVVTEGESGILATAKPTSRPVYEPSKRRLTWPNKAIATLYSAEEPERLRGPQHDAAWCDELGSYKYPETWDMLMLGLRLGADPRAVVTTTPRPTKLVKSILDNPQTVVTRGTTYDNRENLSPTFMEQIINQYEGTRIGRQEILGQMVEDVEGALWTMPMIDEQRIQTQPELERIIVAVDPAVTSNASSDETGIVVCGLGIDGRGYVLDDRSCRLSPDGWARRVAETYHEYQADRVIVEQNQGGETLEFVLGTVDPTVAVKRITASRGKKLRAEPVAALYEQGKISHVAVLPELEDQMRSFTGHEGGADDRVDALVHCLTELILDRPSQGLW